MPGRRWSDGLHQAVEAKEGEVVGEETQTLATITIQNYVRRYESFGGMLACGEREFAQVAERADLADEQIAEPACDDDPPCGLVIIGTERHEARRINRQLRGRSVRHGDPGQSIFFLSLEEDLMRLFGS